MKITKEEMVATFTEWDHRYRENPDEFMNEVHRLLKETPDTYGEAAAVYFEKVLADVRRK